MLTVHVVDSLDAVGESDWNALNTERHPLLDHRFLRALETTGCLGDTTGWYPRYFLLKRGDDQASDDGELVAAVPAYLKTNSYGEFVFDWAWADAYERSGLDYYPKLVAAIPFSPVNGQRFLIHPEEDRDALVPLLARALRQLADTESLSSVHCLFLTNEEQAQISVPLNIETMAADEDENSDGDENNAAGRPKRVVTVSETGFMPRMDCQYHWHNRHYQSFDDFLADCTAKRRKTIRRERRHVQDAGLRVERRTGDSLSAEEWGWVHDFYCSTFDRKWGQPSLSAGFFLALGKTFGEHTLIVLAYDPADEQPDKPVACSVMLHGGGKLYGRYWGCRRDYNALHFEACFYQGIEFCIERGLDCFEPGAQGEHKITRGFVPTLTHSAHYLAHPEFRAAVAEFLIEETQHVKARCTALHDLLPFKSTNDTGP